MDKILNIIREIINGNSIIMDFIEFVNSFVINRNELENSKINRIFNTNYHIIKGSR